MSRPDNGWDSKQAEVLDPLRSYPLPRATTPTGALVGFGIALHLPCHLLVVGEETDRLEPWPRSSAGGSLPNCPGGEAIDGQRTYDAGLANAVVPEDAVGERARTFLADVMAADPDGLEPVVRATRPASVD